MLSNYLNESAALTIFFTKEAERIIIESLGLESFSLDNFKGNEDLSDDNWNLISDILCVGQYNFDSFLSQILKNENHFISDMYQSVISCLISFLQKGFYTDKINICTKEKDPTRENKVRNYYLITRLFVYSR